MSNSRFRAVEAAFHRDVVKAEAPASITSEYYGCNVFNRKVMRRYLSADTREKIYITIEQGATLDREVAEHVAAGMKRWAQDMGATHYTHWFQPLTGGTAEKHDSFTQPHGKGDAIETFSGSLLCQQESDASSFPNGGLRNTFEARGYTAWDPSSPAFIMGDCLCIPTVFISYTGEALDYKVPLLKSEVAVSNAAQRVLRHFGMGDERVQSLLGWEQEFFLVDSALFAQRPDLILAERTLIGHNSARNQQLDDHYFGSIPGRVLEFLKELEFECYKLSIPIKTRHNEVAPNQFEVAPVYEQSNLANDHNLLLMTVMRDVAERHGFVVLFHEKPFEGVNGSGKHCNWSIGTESGVPLLSPGKTEFDNLRFLTFVANVLKAVYDNNALLKSTVLSATNAHRLGANEAPPAIISTFLGDHVSKAFEDLLETENMVHIERESGYSIGVPRVPELLLDNTDRNRTSPFAFTGNRFEFRAVGSSANCASAISAINTIVAHQLNRFADAVDARVAFGEPALKAVIAETCAVYKDAQNICFDGNGYSEEWKQEAAARGLDCETCAPRAQDCLTCPRTLEVYAATGVMSETELRARSEIAWETYSKKIEIEARVLADLTANHVIPLATRYQSILLDNVYKMKAVFPGDEYAELASTDLATIRDLAGHVNRARILVDEMESVVDEVVAIPCQRERAIAFHDRVLGYMNDVRGHVDALEMIVDDQMWPLPKYRELLFIH